MKMMSQNTLKLIIQYLGVGLACLFGAFLVAKGGMLAGIGITALPFVFIFLFFLWKYPKLGFHAVYIFSFFAIGLTRYVSGPLGMGVDGLLVLTLVVSILSNPQNLGKRLKNLGVILALIWFGFTFFQLFNPEAASRVAWFYAVRGLSIYPLLFVIVGRLVKVEIKDYLFLFHVWMGVSVLATVWGMKQLYIGMDSAEQRWLDGGGAITHLLRGKLRVFSFYSDAGQFGASMAHCSLVAGIMGFHTAFKKRKWIYLGVALFTFYGLLISGTRGALFVPLSGIFVYLVLSKNVRILILGLFMAMMGFCFLKFTTIGDSNYNIARMRSALNPEDASLQVRLDNQKKLAVFLANKPFGGGVGAGGNWGARFSPDTFLANTALDSWYVKIWAETGIIGLALHLSHLFIILGFGCYFAFFKMKMSSEKRWWLIALLSGYFGVIVANYGNQIYGQMPLAFVLQLTILFIFFNTDKIQNKLANAANR